MDLKQIEKLMAAMNRAGMRRVAVKEEGLELELEKPGQEGVAQVVVERPQAAAVAPIMKESSAAAVTAQEGEFITSPMVGSFYSAASPDDPAYVKVGDTVKEESVVCIIEAMKVMNEVKSGVQGKVVEVLVSNGAPVEYGTKLFRVT